MWKGMGSYLSCSERMMQTFDEGEGYGRERHVGAAAAPLLQCLPSPSTKCSAEFTMLGVNFVFVQVRDYLLNQKRRGLKQRHGACLSASVWSGLPFF